MSDNASVAQYGTPTPTAVTVDPMLPATGHDVSSQMYFAGGLLLAGILIVCAALRWLGPR